MKKWGAIGSPKSRKRKLWMARIRKQVDRKYKGYASKRAWQLDRKKKAKYRPAKHYREGIGNRGDWARKKVRSVV